MLMRSARHTSGSAANRFQNKDLMSLLMALVRQSRWIMLFALITSVVGGLSSGALVATINQALGIAAGTLSELGWRFLLLALAVLVTRTLSQTCFVRLGQNTKAALRMSTIRRITEASHQNRERHGGARAITMLTQDLDTIVVFFLSVPTLAMNGSIVVGCLAYLGYLSWQILLFALVTILIGSLGFHLANTRTMFHLPTSRRREDDLVGDFRSLFDGAKELKLHRRRPGSDLQGGVLPASVAQSEGEGQNGAGDYPRRSLLRSRRSLYQTGLRPGCRGRRRGRFATRNGQCGGEHALTGSSRAELRS
jgi:ABC-type siderophore export system fused ATPase/permease subunit